MESYRSGHNEPDSKSGCPSGHMGSNPMLSAIFKGGKSFFERFITFFILGIDKTVITVYTVPIQLKQRSDCLRIFIDNKSGLPIYDQIYTQIKSQIISGELKEDEALPSIRNLAKDLRISVVTTKRAYDELEKEGFVYTVAAKGCFVAPKNVELLREENLKKIETYIEKIVELAATCNLKRDDIFEMINMIMEDE